MTLETTPSLVGIRGLARHCPQRHKPGGIGKGEERRAFSGPQQSTEPSGFSYSKDHKNPNAALRNCSPSVEGFSIFSSYNFFRRVFLSVLGKFHGSFHSHELRLFLLPEHSHPLCLLSLPNVLRAPYAFSLLH